MQDALTTVISGTQIWVAEGVYYPDEGAEQTNDVITSTFTLTDGVALYGGFMGTEVSLDELDRETHITVMSGDIDHETNPDTTDVHGVVTDTTLIVGNNAYHVVSGSSLKASALIDGFIITAGQANGDNSYPCDQRCGGGMVNDYSSPTLSNVIFSDNTGDVGGGMYNSGYSSLTLNNVIFSGNSAFQGGGMHNDDHSSPLLTNVTFSGNSAIVEGGGNYNTWESNPSLTNVILWGNTAVISGTQIYNAYNNSTPVISYTLIQDSGGSGTGWDSFLGTDGGGNIDGDPLLVDPLNDDLHLMYGSPAIDSGTNTGCPAVDLDGNQRPYGSVCDMGAYEFYPMNIVMNANNSSPKPGEVITYTILITNNMTETTTGGLISDTLPAGLNFLESITLEPPMSGTVGSAPPILVTDLEIGVGGQVTVTLPVSVSNGLAAGTVITNTAWVTSTEVLTPVLGSTSITVANAPPIAVDDDGTGFTTDEDTPFPTASVLTNDSDLNGDTLVVQSFDTSGTIGQITDNGDGTFDYDPDGQFEDLEAGQQDTDTFTYTISDGNGGTDTATVTITVTGVNEVVMVYLPLMTGK